MYLSSSLFSDRYRIFFCLTIIGSSPVHNLNLLEYLILYLLPVQYVKWFWVWDKYINCPNEMHNTSMIITP